jgi:uncharacterized protein (TIGR03067 family)
MSFKGTRLIKGKGGGSAPVCNYYLFQDTRPRGIDLIVQWKHGAKETWPGIYKLEKGELILHFAVPELARPTSFDPKKVKKGAGLLRLRRVPAR